MKSILILFHLDDYKKDSSEFNYNAFSRFQLWQGTEPIKIETNSIMTRNGTNQNHSIRMSTYYVQGIIQLMTSN